MPTPARGWLQICAQAGREQADWDAQVTGGDMSERGSMGSMPTVDSKTVARMAPIFEKHEGRPIQRPSHSSWRVPQHRRLDTGPRLRKMTALPSRRNAPRGRSSHERRPEHSGHSQRTPQGGPRVPRTIPGRGRPPSRRAEVSGLSHRERSGDASPPRSSVDWAKLYQTTMESLAGHEREASEAESVSLLARAAADLSKTDRKEVLRFAQFLRSRKTK